MHNKHQLLKLFQFTLFYAVPLCVLKFTNNLPAFLKNKSETSPLLAGTSTISCTAQVQFIVRHKYNFLYSKSTISCTAQVQFPVRYK